MTTKQKIIKAIQSLPENATYEDAMERILVMAKIDIGLKQLELGETISHEKVKLKMRKHSLARMLKGITKKNRHSEQDWGGPVGNEKL